MPNINPQHKSISKDFNLLFGAGSFFCLPAYLEMITRG